METGYDPELYDLMTPEDFLGDAAWYESLSGATPGPVLELCAGTGRIALRLARAGATVWALDHDEQMLAALEAKLAELPEAVRSRVHTVSANMQSFQLSQRFPLILCPLRSFQHNRTRVEQLRCLTRVREHLEPGGHFAFNIAFPSPPEALQKLDSGFRLVDERELANGERLRRSEAERFDTVRRTVEAHSRFELCDQNGQTLCTRERVLEFGYLYPEEVRSLLVEAGFCEIELFGGFDERPLSVDTVQELVLRVRAGGGESTHSARITS